MKFLKHPLLCIFTIIILIFTSCSKKNGVESITEDELFTLSYGNFEEQINVFSLNHVGEVNTGIFMKDGFFYLVNGESQKIMELNSYGDLLTLFYNEDSLTKELLDNSGDVERSIHREIAFPFGYTGQISVDSAKCMYVVCTIPRDRQELSENGNLLYCQTILRIPRNGSQIDYIGQQGPGGTPFPYIRNIFTTEKDELVVVSSAENGLMVYWFGKDGFFKYMIPVSVSDCPKISGIDEDSDVFLTVENIVPDYNDYKLYVKIDNYSSYSDKASNAQSGIRYINTLLYPIDIETALYGNPVSIPPYEESVTVDFSKLTYKLPYDFLGVTKNGWKFFVVSTTSGFDVEMIQTETQKVLHRHFDVNRENVLFHNMSLSSDGIISAVYVEKDKARVVWYRTDKLVLN
ncbi:MAG: hypothetical protein HUK25_00645 [Treponema sp.]|nr:hypothetical protein [Treponema sp.]